MLDVSRLEQILTIKRGKAQRDGRPPMLYRRRTVVATCENLVSRQQRSIRDIITQ